MVQTHDLVALEERKAWEKDLTRVRKVMELVKAFFRRGSAWQVLRLQGGGKRAFKEIFENFAVFEMVISPLLRNGGTLIGLCSGGTALLSYMTFLWTKAKVYAVDLEKPSRRLREGIGDRFHHIQGDIFEQNVLKSLESENLHRPLVVAGIHCCGRLSFRVVELGKKLEADIILVVPCCVDRKAAEEVIGKQFESYSDWIRAIELQAPKGYEVRTFQLDEMPTNANIVVEFRRKL